MKYWKKNLIIDNDKKLTKCEIYAKTLISKLGESIGNRHHWNFIGIPLQTRMIAEIFQDSDGKKYEWMCCEDFLLSENETMEFPDEFNITKLYDVFVEKKGKIFIEDKCDTQGNVKAKEIISKHYEDDINEHQRLAARLYLKNHEYSLMNVSKHVNNSSKETLIGMGILEEIGDELVFVHQTFAEYFLAKAMWAQLKEIAERNEFLMFLLENVFIYRRFLIIRDFFEGILTNEYSQIPEKLFEICGSTVDSITWNESKNINLLAREGRKNILKLILEKSQNNIAVLENLTDSTFINLLLPLDGKTILAEALQFQEIIEFLLDKGADVNQRDKHGRTILHYATEERKIELVKYLVSRGARINVEDIEGFTPLHLSVDKNSTQLFYYFIENGADVNTKTDETTPLQRAVQNKNLEMVEELTRRGANVHETNARGWTALYWAVFVRDFNILNHLLEKGARVNVQELRWGETPLHLAATHGDLYCLQILVDSGGDVNIQDINGETPLHHATEEGHLDCLKILANSQGDVNIQNKEGHSVLDSAVFLSQDEIVKYLHYRRIRGARINVEDIEDFTPLHLSVDENSTQLFPYFIKNGSDVNFEMVGKLTRKRANILETNARGWTALYWAVFEGNFNLLNHLLERGARVNVPERRWGHTPLHLAATQGDLYCLQILVDSGGDVNFQDNVGETPLHKAAEEGHFDCLKILVDSGGDVNIQDINGKTPLHIAAEQSHLDCLKILADSGGDVNILNKRGHSVLDSAVSLNRDEIVKYLHDQSWANALKKVFKY